MNKETFTDARTTTFVEDPAIRFTKSNFATLTAVISVEGLSHSL